MTQLETMGAAAKAASRFLMNAGARKDDALLAIAKALRENASAIIEANQTDLKNGKEAGLTDSLLDRLRLDEARIEGMAQGVEQVAALPDPIGKVLDGRTLKNGLKIEKVSVPMGVIGIIYEARPNVTSDAAALCLKAGSAVILRGGKEAIHSNRAIMSVMRAAIAGIGFPEDCIALVQDTSRQSATELMQLTDYLDVLIPRGGAGLIRSVVERQDQPSFRLQRDRNRACPQGRGSCRSARDQGGAGQEAGGDPRLRENKRDPRRLRDSRDRGRLRERVPRLHSRRQGRRQP